jgi:hypothetical protein
MSLWDTQDIAQLASLRRNYNPSQFLLISTKRKGRMRSRRQEGTMLPKGDMRRTTVTQQLTGGTAITILIAIDPGVLQFHTHTHITTPRA